MRARVIINPSSGKQQFQKNMESIVEQLLSDDTISHAEVIKTAKQDDAYHAALDFQDKQVDLVIVVGGDGTVNEVINGLLDGQHKTQLAILPAGTENDFASFMKMPQDVNEFCDMIRQHQILDIDIGKAGTKYFINVASGGILTDISFNVSSATKTMLGKTAYFIEAARQLTSSLEIRTIAVKLRATGHIIDEDILLFIVANSPSVGGFHNAAPKASVSDGLLDVLIIHKQSLLDLAPLFLQIGNGTHIDNPLVSYFQTDELQIECNNSEPVILDIDGEKGDTLPVTIKIIPHAIHLYVPIVPM
jgi:diacylglycerol kinase (ATP)